MATTDISRSLVRLRLPGSLFSPLVLLFFVSPHFGSLLGFACLRMRLGAIVE
jgi:hypothetical protein